MPLSRIVTQTCRLFSTSAKQSLGQHYFRWSSQQMLSIPHQRRILLAQTDGAGTVFDDYCIAPFHAFTNLFARRNLHLSHAQITGPMGIKKIDHIQHLLFIELKAQWEALYGRTPTKDDVNLLHEEFIKELNGSIADFSAPTKGTDLAVAFLARHSILSALTSGYSRDTFNRAAAKLNALYPFATSTTADEVADGARISMLEQNMSKLEVPTSETDRVIFFTDACSDVANVRSAKNIPWIIGVSGYSTHVGITSKKQLASTSAKDLENQREGAKCLLLKSGAHAVIHDMSELPLAIVAAGQALIQGKRPSQSQLLAIDYPECEEHLTVRSGVH